MDLGHGIALIEQLGGDAGVRVELRSAELALIENAGTQHEYVVRVRPTPPAPSVVARDRQRLLSLSDRAEPPHILYVVPHVTASLRARALQDPRVGVAATDDGAVILDGTEWARERPAPAAAAPRGRRPWGRFALMRALIRSGEPRSQAALATEIGIAQQAVALALPKLAALGVQRSPSGWTAADPAALWDRFMDEYPGPGGLRRRWTGAAPLDVQIDRAVEVARTSGATALVSGDLAADEQAPMRRPVTATLFASADVDLSARSTPATDGDETLTVVVPGDRSVFSTAHTWAGGTTTLTDPVLTAWEVANSRGADRHDAVAHLKETVLADRRSR